MIFRLKRAVRDVGRSRTDPNRRGCNDSAIVKFHFPGSLRTAAERLSSLERFLHFAVAPEIRNFFLSRWKNEILYGNVSSPVQIVREQKFKGLDLSSIL